MVARVIPVECFDLVIFGATGDLARRKILPGLYRRWKEGQIPEGCTIVGAARSELDADSFSRPCAQHARRILAGGGSAARYCGQFSGYAGLCHHRCTRRYRLARIGRADAGWQSAGVSISRSHRPCSAISPNA